MKTVSVVFSFNNAFCELAAGAIGSLIRHASTQYQYDIFIVHDDISIQNQDILNTLIKKDNINIRYIKIDFRKFTNENLSYKPKLTKYTFTRLFLHKLFHDIEKILYLDTDIIITSDIAELFNQNLEGHAIGACPDLISIWGIKTLKTQKIDTSFLDISNEYNSRYDYLKHYMGLTDSEICSHFNAGVLLIDLKKAGGGLNSNLPKLLKKRYWNLDQDILNIIFKNDKKILDQKYNVPASRVSIFINETHKLPTIIHFIGTKPTISMCRPMAHYFWEEISSTQLYYSAIEHFIDKKISDLESRIYNHLDDEKVLTVINHKIRNINRLILRRRYIRLVIKFLVDSKKYKKLKKNPNKFFLDSKSKFIRLLGKYYI